MASSISIKKNTFFNMVKSVSAIVFPMISFPYASRVLLADNLGKVNFSNSVVSYFALIAGLGINTYAIRECSKVRHDKSKLEDIAGQLYTINIITTVLAYIALLVTLFIAKPLENYKSLIILQSVIIVATTVGADWMNTVMEDFKYITVRTILFQFLSLVLMILLVKTSDDYIIYALITVISSAGANIINVFYRKKYCHITIVRKIDFRRHLPPILYLFSMLLAQTIYVNSDTTILGIVKGDYEVGLYSVSVKIYNIVQALINSVTFAILPQLSFNFSGRNMKKVNELLRYGINFTVVLGLPCVIGIIALAPEVIQIIGGPDYIEAIMSLRILMVALVASFVGGILGNMILIPSGHDKICMVSSIISAGVNFILNLIFIPTYGLNAAAVTTTVAMIIGIFVKCPFVDKEILLVEKKKIFAGPIIGSLLIVPITFLGKYFIEDVFMRTLCIFLIGVMEYAVILLIFKNELAIDMVGKIKKVRKD